MNITRRFMNLEVGNYTDPIEEARPMIDNDTYVVRIEGFEIQLTLMNDFTMRNGAPIMNGDRPRYMYYAIVPSGVAFDGSQFLPSPHAAQLGIWAIAIELISWLCLGVGDTDPEYFEAYTPDQLAWANSTERETFASYLDSDQILVGSVSCDLDSPMVEDDSHLWSSYTISYVSTADDWDDFVYLPLLMRRGHYVEPLIAESILDQTFAAAQLDPEEARYNGWHNIETWNCALWAFNTEWRYDYIRSCAAFGPFSFDANSARIFCQNVLFDSGYTPDGHSLDLVNFEEIAQAFNEAIHSA